MGFHGSQEPNELPRSAMFVLLFDPALHNVPIYKMITLFIPQGERHNKKNNNKTMLKLQGFFHPSKNCSSANNKPSHSSSEKNNKIICLGLRQHKNIFLIVFIVQK